MIDLHAKLFARLMSRNRQVYFLKIITLAIAFSSSILIIFFSLNEFGYDRFHTNPHEVFRMLEKNTDDQYTRNRLSAKIPPKAYRQVLSKAHGDSLVVSRV